MTVAGLPTDAAEASELARAIARARNERFETVYNRMKLWWTRGRVGSWKRGDGRILLSESEIARRFAELDRIDYRPKEERLGTCSAL